MGSTHRTPDTARPSASSIAPRIQLAFLLFALGVCLAMGGMAYTLGRQAMIEATRQQVAESAREKAATLREWILVHSTALAVTATSPRLLALADHRTAPATAVAPSSTGTAWPELTPLSQVRQLFVRLQLIQAGTREILADTAPPDTPRADIVGRLPEAFLRRAGQGGQALFLLDTEDERKRHQGALILAAPLVPISAASPRKPRDYLLLGLLAMEDIALVLNREDARGGSPTTQAYLLKADATSFGAGRLLASPEDVSPRRAAAPAEVEKPTAAGKTAASAFENSELYRRALALPMEEHAVFGARDHHQERVLAAVEPLAELNARLLLTMDQSEALAPVRRFGGYMAGLTLLLLGFASLLGLQLTRRVSAPIVELTGAVKKLIHSGVLAKHPSEDELCAPSLELSASLLARGGEAGLLAAAINRFLAATHKARRKQNALESAYRELYERAPMAYYTLDANLTILRANQKGVELAGRESALVGLPFSELLAPARAARNRAQACLARFQDGEDILGEDMLLERGDRSLVWVTVTIRADRGSSGELQGARLTAVDVTAVREAEARTRHLLSKLERANRELSDFAHIVAHELKAPLRSVGHLASWLVEDYSEVLDQAGRDNLALLRERVGRLQRLIDGILQFSRIEHRRESAMPVQLELVIREALENLAPPDSVRVTIVKPLPTLHAPPTTLLRILENLIDNSLKFMDKPQGEIRIMAHRLDNFWRIGIEDNGPGIEPRHHGTIFKIFQTLDTSKAPTFKKTYDSTGVGLALVKKLVTSLGGEVGVVSALGRGSEFWFTVPDQAALPPGSEPSLEAHGEEHAAAPEDDESPTT